MSDRDVEEAGLRARERAYDEAWNRGDLASLLSNFTRDAVVVSPRGEAVMGLDQIARVVGSFLSGVAQGSLHRSVIRHVWFPSGTVAVIDGEATLWNLPKSDGEGVTSLTHSFTDVLVKREGTWLIAHVRAHGKTV